jgi:hypothetical protein
MSADDKKSGIFKPVIIGVSISVITAATLSYLGLDKKGSSNSKPQQVASTTEEELRKRQAELEEKIRQLSEKDLARRESELNEKLRQGRETIDDADHQGQHTYQQQSGFPNISGTWQDPNTGASYLIYQNNEFFTMREMSMGVVTAAAKGRINGQNAVFSYNTIFGTTGTGSMVISEDTSHLACVFTDLVSRLTLSVNLYR